MSTYETHLRECIDSLINIRDVLFTSSVNLAITKELKEWDDTMKVGDEVIFTKELFESCDDPNIKILVRLIKAVEETVDTLIDNNNIDYPSEEDDIPF